MKKITRRSFMAAAASDRCRSGSDCLRWFLQHCFFRCRIFRCFQRRCFF